MRPTDLVPVAGPDSASRSTDVFAVGRVLVERAILGEVPGEDHMGPVADAEIFDVADSSLSQLVELFDHPCRVQDNAAGNHARHAGRQHAARQQRELVNLIAHHDGVTGIRATLITNHEVVLTRQSVDDLALGFVAPLQANDTGTGHGNLTTKRWTIYSAQNALSPAIVTRRYGWRNGSCQGLARGQRSKA